MLQTEARKESPKADRPHIYVASLADYNEGIIHGRWIDATQDEDTVRKEIAEMLAASRIPHAEDFAIHDHAKFGTLRLDEFEDLAAVTDAAAHIVESGPVFAELLAHLGGVEDVEEGGRLMREGYRGAFNSFGDYVGQHVESCYEHVIEALPWILRSNIDYDGIGRDLRLSGAVFAVECDGVLHVFEATI